MRPLVVLNSSLPIIDNAASACESPVSKAFSRFKEIPMARGCMTLASTDDESIVTRLQDELQKAAFDYSQLRAEFTVQAERIERLQKALVTELAAKAESERALVVKCTALKLALEEQSQKISILEASLRQSRMESSAPSAEEKAKIVSMLPEVANAGAGLSPLRQQRAEFMRQIRVESGLVRDEVKSISPTLATGIFAASPPKTTLPPRHLPPIGRLSATIRV